MTNQQPFPVKSPEENSTHQALNPTLGLEPAEHQRLRAGSIGQYRGVVQLTELGTITLQSLSGRNTPSDLGKAKAIPA